MKQDGSLYTRSEMDLGDLCLQLRSEEPEYVGPSFMPISSIGPNGAIIHYRATAENASQIQPQMYLLDSGGQYYGGTTDVTRTVHFGVPSPEEKEMYTLVLKGHLALRHAVFPQGTPGQCLDALARQYLWQRGRNYNHGTGHGVGLFLNVHEGPNGISGIRLGNNTQGHVVALEAGMTVSNEPGYYKANEFGIRIENVIQVTRASLKVEEFKEYLTFQDLTLVPYCKDLIDVTLLSKTEIQWINEYHALIAETLLPLMDSEKQQYIEAIEYIRIAAQPL
ncbi:bifunctional Peptidase M24 [Babesia duncani]|uniref:Bifunctional Peptidase M24 n=1 Tax=Babesia duncani TaxID=323732 RepID=A0AAD9UNZ4_9APIC|nr:bifunctional Peptidase M24 [Babesia duncani]